jgi:hypothetical protein
MAGTTFGAIGDQAVACLQLLPNLTPDKDYGDLPECVRLVECGAAARQHSGAAQRSLPL